ncbi:phosphatidylserine synthase isoform X2 [Procambarus clarkii]|uniref:phosphatidylserine synthase isoform X2 n=1 Tax=Procambarus clarkii TaxID=6728 RepID=UPI0037431B40
MATRRRTYSSGSDASDRFISINERPVDDISLEFFYKPHSITLLIVIISSLIYFAFTRDENESIQSNIQYGLGAMVFFFLIISIMAFPNGPFTRPHPAVWRVVFGLSILYMLLLLFIIFQDYRTVRSMFEWFFPELKNFTIDMDKGEWGEKCDDLTFARLWESIDFFCFAHFAGWTMKTLLVRHYGILWTISVMWEITETAFSHLLPNFMECWWDAVILDVLLCNGFGIWCGMQICHLMEMRYYNWESIKDIQTTTGKLKRAVLQFTPESWTAMRWQYYSYVTDPRCKRVGTQCWVYALCMCTESLICIKFGADIFQHTQIRNIIAWVLVQAAGSVMCVYLCVTHHRWQRKRQVSMEDSFDEDTETDCRVSSYIQSLPRKTVTLSTPEDEDSDDEAEGPAKVQRRRKNPQLRRSNRLDQ